MLFTEAFKRAGKDLSADTLQKAFESSKPFDTLGITPPITWKKGNHSPPNEVRFFKADLEKKRFLPITGWRKAIDMK
ncbi:MAG: hypothetical protein MUO68_23795 [Desulfobacteraceae bacterium]|nr:hypothetical protein [Desulfobacteraceae bacterium]